jgi:hypothetical protein
MKGELNRLLPAINSRYGKYGQSNYKKYELLKIPSRLKLKLIMPLEHFKFGHFSKGLTTFIFIAIQIRLF